MKLRLFPRQEDAYFGSPGKVVMDGVPVVPARRLPSMLRRLLTEQALADAEQLSVVFHPLRLALCGGAATALIVGWLRPAPWLLALLLVAILSVIWFFAVSRLLHADAWGEP